MRHSSDTDEARGAFSRFATLYLRDLFECDAFALGSFGPAPDFAWLPLASYRAMINPESRVLRDLADGLCGERRGAETGVAGLNRPRAPTPAGQLLISDLSLGDTASVLLSGKTQDGDRYIAVLQKNGVRVPAYQKLVAGKLQTGIPLHHCVTSLRAEAHLKRYIDELEGGYDKLGMGVLISDTAGHLQYVNDCGSQVLGRVLGGAGAEGVTGTSCINFVFNLIKAFRADESSGVRSRDQMTTLWRDVPEFGQRVPFYVMRLGPAGGADAHYCIIFPDSLHSFEPAQFLTGLGLTAAETRLASQIIAGKSLKCASSELSLSEESARTYLKRVFSKLGVSRQAELVSTVAKLSAPISSQFANPAVRPATSKKDVH